ncbi:MAG TPA: hypothetical protein VGE16_11780 [Albitalea sp.]
MTLISLQALTWSTVAGVVVSALMLASSESAIADASRQPAAQSAARHTFSAKPALFSRERPTATKVAVPLSEGGAMLHEVSAR